MTELLLLAGLLTTIYLTGEVYASTDSHVEQNPTVGKRQP